MFGSVPFGHLITLGAFIFGSGSVRFPSLV